MKNLEESLVVFVSLPIMTYRSLWTLYFLYWLCLLLSSGYMSVVETEWVYVVLLNSNKTYVTLPAVNIFRDALSVVLFSAVLES